jgi:hypothetical protein
VARGCGRCRVSTFFVVIMLWQDVERDMRVVVKLKDVLLIFILAMIQR